MSGELSRNAATIGFGTVCAKKQTHVSRRMHPGTSGSSMTATTFIFAPHLHFNLTTLVTRILGTSVTPWEDKEGTDAPGLDTFMTIISLRLVPGAGGGFPCQHLGPMDRIPWAPYAEG